MNWVELLAAVGIGAIVVKMLDVLWLQRLLQESERKRWLRDQRHSAYSKLAKELISESYWSGAIEE